MEEVDAKREVRYKDGSRAPSSAHRRRSTCSTFGIDQIIPTAAGKLYNKNGAWGTGDGRTEQCVAYFLPQGMELAALVDSPIGTTNFSLRGIVKDAYVNSLS